MAIGGLWGLTCLQYCLGVFICAWGYKRAITWPYGSPPAWKKSLLSLLLVSGVVLIVGTLFAFYAKKFLTPLIIDKPIFLSEWSPAPINTFVLFFQCLCLVPGLIIGYCTRKRISLAILNWIDTATNKYFIPVLATSLSAIIIAMHTNTAALIIHNNIWELFKIIFVMALCYLSITVAVCKRYSPYSIKQLITLLLTPLMITKSYILPPTAAIINPYLPQFRHTSLLLNYNLTMEIMAAPIIIISAFLCHQSPDINTLLLTTPLFLLFRYLMPLHPLLGQSIGALTLSLWGLPLEYCAVPIWALSLCDTIINLAQIFTSYASIMFLLPPQSRVGKPVPVFFTH